MLLTDNEGRRPVIPSDWLARGVQSLITAMLAAVPILIALFAWGHNLEMTVAHNHEQIAVTRQRLSADEAVTTAYQQQISSINRALDTMAVTLATMNQQLTDLESKSR